MANKKRKSRPMKIAVEEQASLLKSEDFFKTGINTVPQIKDVKDLRNQGMLLVPQKTVQELYIKSGPLAKNNEFQAHYWFMNYRHTGEDGSVLDIAIPTCFYNYKQKVTGGSISFDLNDVIAISEKVEKIHNMKVNELQKLHVKERLEHILGVTLEEMSVRFGSLHKHPGGSKSQRFSSTDLDKNPINPGVVYPLENSENTPNFAGIMAVDYDNVCRVAHYEYRIANGELGKDIEYAQGGCTALVKADISEKSIAQQLLGGKPAGYRKSTSETDSTVVDAIEEFYTNLNFEPSTHVVVESNVEEAVRAANYPKYGKSKKFPSAKELIANSLFEAQKKVSSIEVYSSIEKIYNEREFEAVEFSEQRSMLKKLYKLYYKDSDPAYVGKMIADVAEMTQDELVEEFMFVQDSIKEEVHDAMMFWDNQDAEKYEAFVSNAAADEGIEYMKESLIDCGADKAKIEAASDKQIEAWFKVL